MKKKLIIISSIVAIVILVIIVLLGGKREYTIVVSKIDDRSPDRILIVYENNEKITVREIRYLDGVLLCKGNNVTYYGNLENIDELIVVLNDDSEVKAKVVEEEVKK